jgi:hypothetical protein
MEISSLLPCPGAPKRYIAEVTSPGGFDYGMMGYGDSPLEAQKSAMRFVRNVRAIAAKAFELGR